MVFLNLLFLHTRFMNFLIVKGLSESVFLHLQYLNIYRKRNFLIHIKN